MQNFEAMYELLVRPSERPRKYTVADLHTVKALLEHYKDKDGRKAEECRAVLNQNYFFTKPKPTNGKETDTPYFGGPAGLA